MPIRANFVTTYSHRVRDFLHIIAALDELRNEYTALDYGNTITDNDLTELGVTAAEFTTAVASVDAIQALLATGHATNLYRIQGN